MHIYARKCTIIFKGCPCASPPYKRPSEHADVVLHLSRVLVQGITDAPLLSLTTLSTAEMQSERRVALHPSACSFILAVA